MTSISRTEFDKAVKSTNPGTALKAVLAAIQLSAEAMDPDATEKFSNAYAWLAKTTMELNNFCKTEESGVAGDVSEDARKVD